MNLTNEVTWDEVQAALPLCSQSVHMEIQLAIYRNRLEQVLEENHGLRVRDGQLQAKVDAMATELADMHNQLHVPQHTERKVFTVEEAMAIDRAERNGHPIEGCV